MLLFHSLSLSLFFVNNHNKSLALACQTSVKVGGVHRIIRIRQQVFLSSRTLGI